MDNSIKGNLGVFGTVQIVFIILKLVNLVTWNWWIVFIPLFAEIALVILFFIMLFHYLAGNS